MTIVDVIVIAALVGLLCLGAIETTLKLRGGIQ